jgi:hypothetical protein
MSTKKALITGITGSFSTFRISGFLFPEIPCYITSRRSGIEPASMITRLKKGIRGARWPSQGTPGVGV